MATVITLDQENKHFCVIWHEKNMTRSRLQPSWKILEADLTPGLTIELCVQSAQTRWRSSVLLYVDFLDNVPNISKNHQEPSSIIMDAAKDNVRRPVQQGVEEEDDKISFISGWTARWDQDLAGDGGLDPVKDGSSFLLLIDLETIATPHSSCGKKKSVPLQVMEKTLSDRNLADVTFKFPGAGEIKTHSILLASSASPVLSAMFQHDCKEAAKNRNFVIEVEDVSPEVFQGVLQYLYTGSIKEMCKLDMDLLGAADKYQIESLKKECGSSLSKKLTIGTAVHILILAHLHNCPELLQSALDLMVKNSNAITALPEWKYLMKNYPDLGLKATQCLNFANKSVPHRVMETMLTNSTLADVTFKLPGGGEVKAHSAVLASAESPVLAAMFQHDCKESRAMVVEVDDISPEVFQEILRFLYTGMAKEMDELAMDLLVTADKYQIDSLKKKCASSLKKKLAVDNAVRIFVLAHLHNCPQLLHSTLIFMVENVNAVVALPDWKELMKNYPDLYLKATKMLVSRP